MVMIPKNRISQKHEQRIWSNLFAEIKKIDSVNGTETFFDKILTKKEKEFLLRRLVILDLFSQGKTYRKIKETLGTSSGTISGAKDILLGVGYNKRNKKKRYSIDRSIRKPKTEKAFLHTSKVIFKKR